MKLQNIGLALVLVISSAIDAKEKPIQNVMIQELDVIKQSFSVRYAPKEWKNELFGWEVDKAFDKAKKQIAYEKPSTAKEFQKIVQQIFQSAIDYHTLVSVYSTRSAYLPIDIKRVQGRYFITEMDDHSQEYEEIKVGDEVIAINDIPICTYVENIIDKDLGGDRSETGYSLAERIVFDRRGKYGQEVPFGTLRLKVKHQDGVKSTYYFSWYYKKELIKEGPKQQAKGLIQTKLNKPSNAILQRDYSVAFVKDLVKPKKQRLADYTKIESCADCENYREYGFLPPLGEILWETDDEDLFYAYLFKTPFGQKIGYLYIPTFSGSTSEVDEIASIMEFLNLESEALIIDITDNPGGLLFYTFALLSTLSDYPLETLSESVTINQEDVSDAIALAKYCKSVYHSNEELSDDFCGYPVNAKTRLEMIDYANGIVHSWGKGQRMTPPLKHIKKIDPHPRVQYTKPIMVLINELDFSCADIFPAILQDNGRAKIFGKKTAGAGGWVRSYSYPSQLGIGQYSLTGSLIFRLNGTPLENMGVTPDIPYEVTLKDLRDNYSDYIRAVNEAVREMILAEQDV